MGVDSVADEPAEELAAHAQAPAVVQHRPGRLALERRRVRGPLAGDDEVGAARELVEADEVEHELRTGHELRAERRERGTEAAAGARTRELAVRDELLERREALLEHEHHLG